MALEEIEQLRTKIERIDASIVEMVGRRQLLARKIGTLKSQSGLDMRVPAVEEKVQSRYVKAADCGGLSNELACDLARLLITHSLLVQKSGRE